MLHLHLKYAQIMKNIAMPKDENGAKQKPEGYQAFVFKIS
jgi:hypothetical protein